MYFVRKTMSDIRFISTRPLDKNNYNITFKILMLIDALGLALIALCTVAEGMEDWDIEFRDHFFGNEIAMYFWILGALLATFGLILIMFNCAAMENLPYVEHVGMFMLTFAPVVNCVGWYFLDTGDLLDNYTLIATEIMEFIGMNLLNYSYWCTTAWSDCFAEVSGYCVLACAAILDVFVYPENIYSPVVSLRTSSVNRMDVIGLIALIVVSIGKYQMHIDGISEYSNEKEPPARELIPCLPAGEGAQSKRKSATVVKDYND